MGTPLCQYASDWIKTTLVVPASYRAIMPAIAGGQHMAKRTQSKPRPGRPRSQSAERAEIKGILTRVNPEGWRVLGMLPLELAVPLQCLCVAGANDSPT